MVSFLEIYKIEKKWQALFVRAPALYVVGRDLQSTTLNKVDLQSTKSQAMLIRLESLRVPASGDYKSPVI
jgi:hypothetical protein